MGEAASRMRQAHVVEGAPTGRLGSPKGVPSEQWAWRKIFEIAQEQLGMADTGGQQSDSNLPATVETSLTSSSSLKPEGEVREAEQMDTVVGEPECNLAGEPRSQPVGERDNSDPKLSVGYHKGSHHFTNGVIGPEFCNRLGKNMDFDMTVLWIAAWCRRDPDVREELFDQLEAIDGFSKMLTDRLNASTPQKWRASMIRALSDAASTTDQGLQRPLSLVEVTTLIAEWNSQRRVLLDNDGDDLLDAIDDLPPDLLNQVVVTLMGSKAGEGSLFTKPGDQYPMWKALNIFRHWSAVGREDEIEVHHKAARVSADKIKEYLCEEVE